MGLPAGPVPPRVDARVKAGLLELVDHAAEAGWSTRAAAGQLGLDDTRAGRWLARRDAGRLADAPPGPGEAAHGLLDWERAAVVKLADEWGEIDRSHRKLAHRGSRLEYVRVFSAQPDFDPTSSDREFVVAMSDYSLTVLGDALSKLVEERAPNVRLHIQQLSSQSVDHATEALRTTDALVLPHGFLSDLSYLELYTDDWVCLVSADNDRVGNELTTGQLAELPWVFTYHRPTAYTPADRQMRALGIEPNIRIVAESFVALPFLIGGTDRIALIQRKLIDQLSGLDQLRTMACPFGPDPLVEALWWHPLNDHDPGHRWLRSLFRDAADQAA